MSTSTPSAVIKGMMVESSPLYIIILGGGDGTALLPLLLLLKLLLCPECPAMAVSMFASSWSNILPMLSLRMDLP